MTKKVSQANKNVRIVTNEDIKKYVPMVNMWIRKSVVKNFSDSSTRKDDDEHSLGNTGMSIADIKQDLFAEVVVALQKYNPEYRTAEGKGVKESTFVYQHLYNRIGQKMKRLTKLRQGYSKWSIPVEELFGERYEED